MIQQQEQHKSKHVTNEQLYGPRCVKPSYPYSLDTVYDTLKVILELESAAAMPVERIKRKGYRGQPLSHFTPRLNGPMNPGRRNRDGHRGQPTFEMYGCITSASEIGKLFGTISAIKIHERIDYLAKCGLVEYEFYKPKYKTKNMKDKPFWYTRLNITDKAKLLMELYKKMSNSIIFPVL